MHPELSKTRARLSFASSRLSPTTTKAPGGNLQAFAVAAEPVHPALDIGVKLLPVTEAAAAGEHRLGGFRRQLPAVIGCPAWTNLTVTPNALENVRKFLKAVVFEGHGPGRFYLPGNTFCDGIVIHEGEVIENDDAHRAVTAIGLLCLEYMHVPRNDPAGTRARPIR